MSSHVQWLSYPVVSVQVEKYEICKPRSDSKMFRRSEGLRSVKNVTDYEDLVTSKPVSAPNDSKSRGRVGKKTVNRSWKQRRGRTRICLIGAVASV